jgi:hypothetical protein
MFIEICGTVTGSHRHYARFTAVRQARKSREKLVLQPWAKSILPANPKLDSQDAG